MLGKMVFRRSIWATRERKEAGEWLGVLQTEEIFFESYCSFTAAGGPLSFCGVWVD